MTSFFAEIWSVNRSWSQESNKIKFASIGHLESDIQVGMTKYQHWQITRFDFEGCDFHALPYFIFLP
jgi:hypothetical protein